MPVPDKVPEVVAEGATAAAGFTAYSWNVFRYLGDYLHLFGVLVLLVVICKNKSVAGISRGTQILYFLTFITRYLDLVDHSQTTYLVFFKLTYISTAVFVLFMFYQLDSTYDRRNDTCNLMVFIIPCFTAALLLTAEWTVLEILWTFSEFIEGFAMVPQYIFCYRVRARDVGQSLYIICLGSYRVFYALNWIYKKLMMPHYSDIQSWLGGLMDIVLFMDFLNYRFTGSSCLRTMVLSVDSKINEITDKIEMKVVGSSRSDRMQTEGGEMRRRKKGGDDQLDAAV